MALLRLFSLQTKWICGMVGVVSGLCWSQHKNGKTNLKRRTWTKYASTNRFINQIYRYKIVIVSSEKLSTSIDWMLDKCFASSDEREKKNTKYDKTDTQHKLVNEINQQKQPVWMFKSVRVRVVCVAAHLFKLFNIEYAWSVDKWVFSTFSNFFG